MLAVASGRGPSISSCGYASNRSSSSVEDLTINLNYHEQQHQPQRQKKQASRPRLQLQAKQQVDARPQKSNNDGHARGKGGPRGGGGNGAARKVLDGGASRNKSLLSDVAEISPTGDGDAPRQDALERFLAAVTSTHAVDIFKVEPPPPHTPGHRVSTHYLHVARPHRRHFVSLLAVVLFGLLVRKGRRFETHTNDDEKKTYVARWSVI